MPRVRVRGNTYRLIPSHFPPLNIFENLLDPAELDAAYALESLTNDRIRDQVGDILLVAPADRVTGPGTTAIMAAFTHIGTESRFSRGRYGVYYAARNLDTAIEESRASRARFLRATNEGPQILTMRCYICAIDALLVDLRGDAKIHERDNWHHAQLAGEELRRANEKGILYQSVRHPGGECVAAFTPKALKPPANQAGHYQFHWDGNEVKAVFSVTQVR